MSEQRDLNNDVERQAIRTLHGGDPPSEKVALEGLAPLEQKLQRRFETSMRRNAERSHYMEKVQAPLRQLMSADEEVADGIRLMARAAERAQQRRSELPKTEPVGAQIMPGSVLNLFGHPYDYAWDWRAPGGGPEYTNADKNQGTAYWTIRGAGHSSAAAAGVGQFFRPLPTTNILRFGTYVEYFYQWYDASAMDTAHNDGNINLLVVAYDQRTGISQTVFDKRIGMWSDGTGWGEAHGEENDGAVWPPDLSVTFDLRVLSLLFRGIQRPEFIFWLWTDGSCDDTGIGTWTGSTAWSDMVIRPIYMAFEES